MKNQISDFVEHIYTLTLTDPASTILASNFFEGIMNPYIKNKLRYCKISNLQDMFKFAFEEDQKQKIRALDFEPNLTQQPIVTFKSLRTALVTNVEMRVISLRIVPCIKIIPYNITIPHQISNIHMHPTVGQIAKTHMFAPITQTLNNLLEQLKSYP